MAALSGPLPGLVSKLRTKILLVKAGQTRIERPNHVSAKGVLLYVEKYCTTSIYKKTDEG
jgi:hypothetical protein